MKIRSRLFIFFILLSMIPLAIIGSVSIYYSTIETEENVGNYSTQIVIEISKQIQREIIDIENQAQTIAISHEVIDFMNITDDDTSFVKVRAKENIETYLNQFSNIVSSIVVYTDYDEVHAGGNRILQTGKTGSIYGKILESGSFNNWMYLELSENRLKLTDRIILFKKIFGPLSGRKGILQYVPPIGKFRSILEGVNLGKESSLYLIDDKKRVLVSTERSLEGKSIYEDFSNIIDRNRSNGYRIFQFKNKRLLTCYSLLNNEDWYIIGSVPITNLTERTRSIKYIVLLTVLICLVITFSFSQFVTQSVVVPIQKVSNFLIDMAAHKEVNLEHRIRDKSQDEISILADAYNQIQDLVSLNIASLKGANEKLKEMDRAKTDFFSNISHELRTPLTLILSPLESFLAGDYGTSIVNTHKVFHSMHTNSLRLLKLINTLLDFSRIEAGKMKLRKTAIDLNKLLGFYVSSVASGIADRGLEIEFIDFPEKIVLCLDRDLIEKAFFNLISNAIKFSPRGGRITVRLKKDKTEALLSVQDQGIGIPPDKQTAIFDRFTQVDGGSSRLYEGTGIGLAFTKEIIKLHEGTISVKSRPGAGSTFIIRFPLPENGRDCYSVKVSLEDEDDFLTVKSWLTADIISDTGKKRKVSSKNEGEAGGGNKNEEDSDQHMSHRDGNGGEKILIVDDNTNMRDFITSLIEKRYTVYTAEHGKEALKVMEHLTPDLILSDVMMPEMDGLELCRRLKENEMTKQIPVILLTARLDISTRIEGLEQKADDYLIKPFNARELFARIENLLTKHRLEKQLSEIAAYLWGEMEITRHLQESLLPENPEIPGFDLACFIQSASEVSGDYYDVIHQDNKSWLVIGDVSGHGLPAGLVMMMVQTAIFSLIQNEPDIKPSKLLSNLNIIIKRNIQKLNLEKYMTINVFALQEKGRFLFAGLHQDIFVYRKKSGTVEIVETKGMWVGLIDDISDLVSNDTLELEKGDTVLLYTDGITEAVRKEWLPGQPGKRFGEARLMKILKQEGNNLPGQIKSRLQKELENYICDDDFTFMVLQYKGE